MSRASSKKESHVGLHQARSPVDQRQSEMVWGKCKRIHPISLSFFIYNSRLQGKESINFRLRRLMMDASIFFDLVCTIFNCLQSSQCKFLRLGQSSDSGDIEALVGPVVLQCSQKIGTFQV